MGSHPTIYFDGGQFCIGVALYDPVGVLVCVHGDYNENWATNNEAEMAAASKAVELGLSY